LAILLWRVRPRQRHASHQLHAIPHSVEVIMASDKSTELGGKPVTIAELD